VSAPMNPLRGLASDAEAITRYASTIEGPVVLVAHSYVAVISHAAPAIENVRALVFLSAFALAEARLRQRDGAVPAVNARVHQRAHALRRSRRRRRARPIHQTDAFHETSCADLSEDVAGRWLSASARSRRRVHEAATVIGWKDLPCWYLVSEHDNAIPPDANASWRSV